MKKILATFWTWKFRPIVLGSAAVVLAIIAIVGSISNLLQGPTTVAPPNAAEWLSAISTFWGAVAAALGAALTGGALLIAAMTYQRQVHDKHAELLDKRREDEKKRREHAEAVTVSITPYKPRDLHPYLVPVEERLSIEVRNDGKVAVFGVTLVVVDRQRRELAPQHFFHSLLPGKREEVLEVASNVDGAYVLFTDSAGTRWKRWHNGDLEEAKAYPITTNGR